jgi:glycosyltransferase involved in cell wall biosynthesis
MKEDRYTGECLKTNGSCPENIAMLGSLPPIRALSSYCLELALAISDLGRVEFISFNRIYPSFLYPGGDLQDDNTYPTITHPGLRIRRYLTWYNPTTWIAEAICANGELLHAQWWSLPLSPIYMIVCLGFRLRRKPVVFTIHNVQSHKKHFLYRFVTKVVLRLGSYFIVHSKPHIAQLIKYYSIPPERVIQIPHGPLDFHVQNDMDRNLVRSEMGFHTHEKIILLFGAIRPYKGVDTALKAFAKVVARIPEARLVIAGKLWERWERYWRLIERLGIGDNIKTYLRYIPSGEVWKFFTASDLVILPYHHFDAQSGVGATAISFRKPIIVSDVGGLPELVVDRRYVVPAKNPAALARTIVNCMQDTDQFAQMSDGAKSVAEKMAWPAIAKKTWDIYRNALGLPRDHEDGKKR